MEQRTRSALRAYTLPRLRWIRRSGDEGQAVVEFAIVLPLLMLVILGIVKFGVIFSNHIELTDAARAGARQFSIERGIPNPGPCQDTATAVQTAAGGLSTGDLHIQVAVDNGTPVDVTSSSATCPVTLVSGHAATVYAKYPCELQILGVNFLPGCTLTAKVSERIE